MSCISRTNLCPASGDDVNVLLQKILQSLNEGAGGGGSSGVSAIKVNGGANQTGVVSLTIPTTPAGIGLLNFADTNAHADASIYINSGATEIIKVVGATGNVQMAAARIHRDVNNSQIAFIGAQSKSVGAFLEVNGDTSAGLGSVTLTTKGRVLGEGTFKIFNAPLASLAQTLRAAMTWEGDWSLTPTWNDAADAFVAFDVNPTNTASAAGALLGRFRASSVSQWELTKSGATTQLGSGTMMQLRLPDTSSATVGGIYFNSVLAIHNFGTGNIFAGALAGNLTMTGTNNVGVGVSALVSITTGSFNSAIGAQALQSNTTGGSNAAVGVNALQTNTTGSSNMAIGVQALQLNTTGSSSVAIGTQALLANTSGANNVAIGHQAMVANTTSVFNVSVGYQSTLSNTTGSFNVALGALTLLLNTTGESNIAIGLSALQVCTTGMRNIALGFQAGDNLTTGSDNIIIGSDINSPTATNSKTLTLGNLIFGTALDGTGTTVSSGNIAVGIITPFQKFSVLGAIGAYELATDSANYSRTSIAPAAGNHLIRTEAAGTGTLRILQVGTGPKVGTDIAGINTIFHGGQSTGAGAGGSILFQVSAAGGAGAAVNALATVITIASTGTTTFTAGGIFGAPVRLKGYTVATLPAGVQGDTAFVTDAVAPAFLVAVVGGGGVVTTVFYNGAAWVAQ